MSEDTAVDLCDSCVYLQVNGPDEGAEWPEDYDGMLDVWRGHYFAPVVMDEDLTPVEPYFSKTPCDGCGDGWAGNRWPYVAVRDEEAA